MKKYWKLIIIVVSLFVMWNLVWFGYKIFKYDKFFKNIPENEWGDILLRKMDTSMT